jgi:hypothetical protein
MLYVCRADVDVDLKADVDVGVDADVDVNVVVGAPKKSESEQNQPIGRKTSACTHSSLSEKTVHGFSNYCM